MSDNDEKAATAVDVEVQENGDVLCNTKAPSDDDDQDNSTARSGKLTADSDISRPDRRIWVITTAAMPWRTGTSVNPLLRALYLTRGRPKEFVTLLVPWLSDAASRKKLYGAENDKIQTREDQEEWIRDYCRTRCNCPEEESNLRIRFWDGTYQDAFGSIFPTVDICALIPQDEADVAILEEPEHLNWFRVPSPNEDENTTLGWSHLFRHSVGILHTNYAAYVKQYGMGTSIITAPALNALSSLVVRAYCHRVIRLSSTLPSLSPKAVTCNVHGVRSEFFDSPIPSDASKNAAPVYFIGKLIWAKGFDHVLELQERYRALTGDYFAIDVYGSGNDEKAIQRAFFGRRTDSAVSDEQAEAAPSESSAQDNVAAQVFGKQASLRELVLEGYPDTAHSTIESIEDNDASMDNKSEQAETTVAVDSEANETTGEADNEANAPWDIIGDLSGKTISTGVETAEAAVSVIESVVEAFFGRGDAKGEESEKSKERKTGKSPLSFVPARARFTWRRTPIPAKFPGVVDHAVLRDVPEHTIFLNMSTTEVLCTTSAEALAMGKFVVLPKHPSNEFFYQFPNALAYVDIDDCAAKMQYALTNQPEPLSETHRHALSWEGATERLCHAAGITEEEENSWKKDGTIESDFKAAKFHVESARSSQFVRNIFPFGKRSAPPSRQGSL